jgi:hypothetical protein
MKDAGRKPGSDRDAVPDLHLPGPKKTLAAAPKSASIAQASPPKPPPARGMEATADDDDFDMEVDRNLNPTAYMASSGTRPKAASVGEVGPGVGGRIELGDAIVQDSRRHGRSHDKVVPKPRYGDKAVNALIVLVAAGGAGAALVRFVHRAAGWNVLPLVPAAFDGSSAIWSGAAALLSLAVAIALAIAALYAKPRSTGYLLSALGMVVVAIAMITVTFSVEPDGPPEIAPFGGRLVPWALPLVPLGIALRFLWNGWNAPYEEAFAKERFVGALWSVVAAAVAVVGLELSCGAGVARLFH